MDALSNLISEGSLDELSAFLARRNCLCIRQATSQMRTIDQEVNGEND